MVDTNHRSSLVIPKVIQEEIAKIYIGFFNRGPDAGGLLYWSNLMLGGLSRDAIVRGFEQSQEFIDQYANLNSQERVNKIYNAILDRDADPDGLQFWSGLLDAGLSVGTLVTTIVDVASQQGDTVDGNLVRNKIDLALRQVSAVVDDLPAMPWSIDTGYEQINIANAIEAILGIEMAANEQIFSLLGQNSFYATDFDEAWQLGYTGKGVVVATIDTGIDLNNLALTKNLSPLSWNFVEQSANVQDISGHGTAVASLIVGNTTSAGELPLFLGGAYDAQLMVLKIMNHERESGTDHLVDALYYAVDHGANIINLSLGMSTAEEVVQEAIAYAVERGVIVVMASGNSGDAIPQLPARYAMDHDLLLAVGASSQNPEGEFVFADFSNLAGAATPYNYVIAPGADVFAYDLNGSIAQFSGSSFAAPLVSAQAAILMSIQSGLSPNYIINAIVNSTVDIIGIQEVSDSLVL